MTLAFYIALQTTTVAAATSFFVAPASVAFPRTAARVTVAFE